MLDHFTGLVMMGTLRISSFFLSIREKIDEEKNALSPSDPGFSPLQPSPNLGEYPKHTILHKAKATSGSQESGMKPKHKGADASETECGSSIELGKKDESTALFEENLLLYISQSSSRLDDIKRFGTFEIPSLLCVYAYILNLPSLLAGPFLTFPDFMNYVNDQLVGSIMRIPVIRIKFFFSLIKQTMFSLISALLFMLIFFKSDQICIFLISSICHETCGQEIEYIREAGIMALLGDNDSPFGADSGTLPLYWRIVVMWSAFFLIRMKYYAAWKLSRCCGVLQGMDLIDMKASLLEDNTGPQLPSSESTSIPKQDDKASDKEDNCGVK
ncbi:hypothetical protein ADUPG1_012862 [Aduncisulcus paluster]|uniref:Uncharacterized protein n=1 Tax=Aduncisulcus paluster TaxID=2918883 RepID=A0ABQ5K0X6_9EUKA|nr:hypothetical protein ADUPG1_012862 [Aduncisulcus paluster]